MSDPSAATPVTMQQAVTALRERGATVCFEQVHIDQAQLTREADGSVSHGLVTFPLPATQAGTEASLQALVRADPDYIWEAEPEESVVTIYPRAGGALDWPVPARDWTGVPWIEAIRSIGLEDHGITLFPRGVERRANLALDGRCEELPARRWLSAVVAQVGAAHYWNLAGIELERSLVIGQLAPE